MARLKIRRLGYAMGAEVTGVDLSKPLDERVVAEVRQAWLDHIVLCFPGQNLDGEKLRGFCSQFGDLEDNQRSINRDPAQPGIMTLSNKPVVVNGQPVVGYGRGSYWHTDFSYTDRPTTITFLLAKDLPEVGGDTMFANMYMAYESLSPAFQRLIESLLGVHDYTLGTGSSRQTPEQQAKMKQLNPPVVHSVVRSHPETGRKALYIGNRVRNFVGMTAEETKPLLDYLNRHATSYEFLYSHRWTVDDLVLWDNRCALHYAVQNYDQAQLRRMLRSSLVGQRSGYLLDVPAVSEAASVAG
jgi:taurine dioxygenase